MASFDTCLSAVNYNPDYDQHLIVLLAAALNGRHHFAGRHGENTEGRFVRSAGLARFLFRVKCCAASQMSDVINAGPVGKVPSLPANSVRLFQFWKVRDRIARLMAG